MYKFVSLKQSVLCFCLLATNTMTLSAQTAAKQQLQSILSGLKTYQAKFEQRVTDIENTLLQNAQGKIVLQQPNQLYWELLAPNESVLLADGQNIWNIDPFLEQVVVYSADKALENNPLILLTDPNSSQWQEFNVSVKGSEFFIKPIAADGSIVSLRLLFKDNQLVELESTDAQQQKSHLKFSEIKQNQSLPKNTFIFVQPDGYELDDQRKV